MPAMIPPAIGPAIHTHQSVHVPVASAGPNQRAGFMAAPVSGPTARTSIVITNPTVNPAVFANGPRSSITVAKTAHTRKKVATASTSTAFPSMYPESTLGVPPFTDATAGEGGKYFRRGAGATGPASCATMYTALRTVGILPVTHRATWIAGLKTAPEMWTISDTMMAIVRPWASAIAS